MFIDYLEQFAGFFGLNADTVWVLQIFVVVFLTLSASYVVNNLLKKLLVKFEKTKNIWDDALVIALRNPARKMVWVIGFTFALEIVHKEAEAEILSAIYPIRDVAVIALIVWFINRLIRIILDNYISQKTIKGEAVDYTTVDAVGKILRAAVIITGALIILQTLGFSVSGVLAFGGVGGLALGFAAKDLLANFFGALMIYFDRPFQVGDWIRSPDQEIEGVVEEIGWRQTRIRTFDKRPLYVPNSVFSTIAVENPSRMTNRRIFEHVGVRYCDAAKLKHITDQVREMLQHHDEIDQNVTLIVNVNKFSASSIDFMVYAFTKTTNWVYFHQVKQDIMLKMNDIIEENEAEIAFPTSTLHIPDGIDIHGEKA